MLFLWGTNFKLHQVIVYEVTHATKKFVYKNAAIRKMSKTEIGSLFCKFNGNLATGKFGCTGQKLLNCKLITDTATFRKEIRKPHVKNFMEIGPEAGIILYYKRHYQPKNPSYLYHGLLWVSKLIMSRWHYYEVVPQAYCNKLLAYSSYKDNDSSLIVLQAMEVARDAIAAQNDLHSYNRTLRALAPSLDMSDWETDHDFYQLGTSPEEKAYLLRLREQNRKRLLTFSSETGSHPITQALMLCAKLYSLQIEKSGKIVEKSALKGVNRKTFHKHHNDILRFYLGPLYHLLYRQNTITNRNFQLIYRTSQKIAVSRYYDKRFMIKNGDICLAFGHCDIPHLAAVDETITFLLDRICDELK